MRDLYYKKTYQSSINKKYISRGVWKTESAFEGTAEGSMIALWGITTFRYLKKKKKTAMQCNFQTRNKFFLFAEKPHCFSHTSQNDASVQIVEDSCFII